MPLARYHGRTRGAPGSFCPQRPRAWQNIQAQIAHEVNATICRACRGSVACRRNAPVPPRSGRLQRMQGLRGNGTGANVRRAKGRVQGIRACKRPQVFEIRDSMVASWCTLWRHKVAWGLYAASFGRVPGLAPGQESWSESKQA